jgi:hypothetical protein
VNVPQSTVEDMTVTRTLGRGGTTHYCGWSGEDFNLLLIDGATGRNGTSVGTSHLISRSTNSGKIPRCQTGVVKRVRLMQDLVEQATAAEYPSWHIPSVQ